VGTIYRLRWQVELTFRNWKSLLKINVLKGTRTERVQCIIYGRLITIIMLAMISSYASWYAEDYLQRELSLPIDIIRNSRIWRFTLKCCIAMSF
jgi:IS4 transposase